MPANHNITVTLPVGKHARGKVVYLQPKTERQREKSATAHVVTRAWLGVNRYPAIYPDPLGPQRLMLASSCRSLTR